MRQTHKKASDLILNTFRPLFLLLLVISYLVIGHVVEYLYGPKVSQSLVLSGPYQLFILILVCLVLVANFIRLIYKGQIKSHDYFTNLGLIGLFTLGIISNVNGPYQSVKAFMNPELGKSYNYANLEMFEVSILNRNTNERRFLDLNYSLRPQGLNLDFGPTYLFSYLPFSHHTYNLKDAQGEVSAVIEVLNNDTGKEDKKLLSTNNYDYQNFLIIGDSIIYLYNEEKLNCLMDLSNVNPSCISMLRRRSLSELKTELCKDGHFMLTRSGFISLANECRLHEIHDRLLVGNQILSIIEYFPNKQLEEDYHSVRDLKLKNTDVIKFIEKTTPKRVRFIKPAQMMEIVDLEGDFHDLTFGHKQFKLPFTYRVFRSDGVLKLQLNESVFEFQKGKMISFHGYDISILSLAPQSNKFKILFLKDPLRSFKISFFAIFCLGLLVFVKSRWASK